MSSLKKLSFTNIYEGYLVFNMKHNGKDFEKDKKIKFAS